MALLFDSLLVHGEGELSFATSAAWLLAELGRPITNRHERSREKACAEFDVSSGQRERKSHCLFLCVFLMISERERESQTIHKHSLSFTSHSRSAARAAPPCSPWSTAPPPAAPSSTASTPTLAAAAPPPPPRSHLQPHQQQQHRCLPRRRRLRTNLAQGGHFCPKYMSSAAGAQAPQSYKAV